MRNLLLAALSFPVPMAIAQPPAGYYAAAEGLTGEALRSALNGIISPHSVVAYSALWSAFARTDRRPDGAVWDMYSDVPGGTPDYLFQFITDQCGNYNGEGDCFNREHTFPVSWFDDAVPMRSDLHHIYPADAWVNQQRGNWPYGIVGSADYTSSNGSKRGPCAYPGCSGTVFEPIDAYKGDLARAHFYMLTRYLDESAGWTAPVLAQGEFIPWVESLLMAWHIADPVSEKERARNDSVFVIQGNRNPYIDEPQWASSIWGAQASISESAAIAGRAWYAEGYLHIPAAAGCTGCILRVHDAMGRTLTERALPAGTASAPFEAPPGYYVAVLAGEHQQVLRFVR